MKRPRFMASLSIRTSGHKPPTRYLIGLPNVSSGEFPAAELNEVERKTPHQAHLTGGLHRLLQQRQTFIDSFGKRQGSAESGRRGRELQTIRSFPTQGDTALEQRDCLRRIAALSVHDPKAEMGISSAIGVTGDLGNLDRFFAVCHRLGKSANLGEHGGEPRARMNRKDRWLAEPLVQQLAAESLDRGLELRDRAIVVAALPIDESDLVGRANAKCVVSERGAEGTGVPPGVERSLAVTDEAQIVRHRLGDLSESERIV